MRASRASRRARVRVSAFLGQAQCEPDSTAGELPEDGEDCAALACRHLSAEQAQRSLELLDGLHRLTLFLIDVTEADVKIRASQG